MCTVLCIEPIKYRHIIEIITNLWYIGVWKQQQSFCIDSLKGVRLLSFLFSTLIFFFLFFPSFDDAYLSLIALILPECQMHFPFLGFFLLADRSRIWKELEKLLRDSERNDFPISSSSHHVVFDTKSCYHFPREIPL